MGRAKLSVIRSRAANRPHKLVASVIFVQVIAAVTVAEVVSAVGTKAGVGGPESEIFFFFLIGVLKNLRLVTLPQYLPVKRHLRK